MNSEQPISPRRRLQVLLAIPDSQRTEAEWDELVELEISLAPGNRADNPRQEYMPRGPASSPTPNGKPKQNAGPKNRKPIRKPRGNPPKGNPA